MARINTEMPADVQYAAQHLLQAQLQFRQREAQQKAAQRERQEQMQFAQQQMAMEMFNKGNQSQLQAKRLQLDISREQGKQAIETAKFLSEQEQKRRDQQAEFGKKITLEQLKAALGEKSKEGERRWRTGERLGSQDFRTGERLGSEGFRAGERLGSETFKAGESKIGREFGREKLTVQEEGKGRRQRAEFEQQKGRDDFNADLRIALKNMENFGRSTSRGGAAKSKKELVASLDKVVAQANKAAMMYQKQGALGQLSGDPKKEQRKWNSLAQALASVSTKINAKDVSAANWKEAVMDSITGSGLWGAKTKADQDMLALLRSLGLDISRLGATRNPTKNLTPQSVKKVTGAGTPANVSGVGGNTGGQGGTMSPGARKRLQNKYGIGP